MSITTIQEKGTDMNRNQPKPRTPKQVKNIREIKMPPKDGQRRVDIVGAAVSGIFIAYIVAAFTLVGTHNVVLSIIVMLVLLAASYVACKCIDNHYNGGR